MLWFNKGNHLRQLIIQSVLLWWQWNGKWHIQLLFSVWQATGLAWLCSRRFWRRSWRLCSWDSGHFSSIPFITITIRLMLEGNCTRKKFNFHKSLTSPRACVMVVVGRPTVRRSWDSNQNRDGVALSSLAVGRGENLHGHDECFFALKPSWKTPNYME